MTSAKDYDFITYNQYLEYVNSTDQKIEYSNGVIFYMSPTHPVHNKIQNELYFQLRSILKECGKCDVYTSDIAIKFESEDEEHQFEPDVMVTCDNKFDGAIYKGKPTLIIEVLSKATKERDLGLKLNVYEKFGVKEYWIVNVNSREIIVYSDNINSKYHTKKTYVEGIELIWNNTTINIKEVFRQ